MISAAALATCDKIPPSFSSLPKLAISLDSSDTQLESPAPSKHRLRYGIKTPKPPPVILWHRTKEFLTPQPFPKFPNSLRFPNIKKRSPDGGDYRL